MVTLGRLLADLSIELYAYKVFSNTEKGFSSLLTWARKLTDPYAEVHFVMEATARPPGGIYHQKFAYFLDDHGCALSIVLPNKISNYIKTLGVKTVTDKSCSEAIARFGLERKSDSWKRSKSTYKSLQQLTRARSGRFRAFGCKKSATCRKPGSRTVGAEFRAFKGSDQVSQQARKGNQRRYRPDR